MAEEKSLIRFYTRGEVFAPVWSEKQINYYQNFYKNNHTVLSTDSSGTFIINPEKTSSNKDVEMFTLHLKRHDKASVPVGTLFTTLKKHHHIEFFMKEWLTDARFAPNEIIIDQSSCLLLACCLAFCSCDVETYTERAFELLSGMFLKKIC